MQSPFYQGFRGACKHLNSHSWEIRIPWLWTASRSLFPALLRRNPLPARLHNGFVAGAPRGCDAGASQVVRSHAGSMGTRAQVPSPIAPTPQFQSRPLPGLPLPLQVFGMIGYKRGKGMPISRLAREMGTNS